MHTSVSMMHILHTSWSADFGATLYPTSPTATNTSVAKKIVSIPPPLNCRGTCTFAGSAACMDAMRESRNMSGDDDRIDIVLM